MKIIFFAVSVIALALVGEAASAQPELTPEMTYYCCPPIEGANFIVQYVAGDHSFNCEYNLPPSSNPIYCPYTVKGKLRKGLGPPECPAHGVRNYGLHEGRNCLNSELQPEVPN